MFRERVEEASRRAKIEYKEMEEKTRDRKRKRGDDNFDDRDELYKNRSSRGQFIGRPQTFVEFQLLFKLHFYT